jgi:hypothetical protein
MVRSSSCGILTFGSRRCACTIFDRRFERLRVSQELVLPCNDLHTLLDIRDALDLDLQRDPVKQLWAEFAFLRIHAADDDELRRVADADAFTLDRVDSHGSRIKQRIHHIVIEQVDLINIQDATVRLCEYPWLKRL